MKTKQETHSGSISSAAKEKVRKILAFMGDKVYKPMKAKSLAELIGVPKSKRTEFKNIISHLLQSGEIVISSKGNLSLPRQLGIHKGVFSGTRHGYGFVTLDDAKLAADCGDIFIPPSSVNDAVNKDTVLCKITTADSGSRRAEGEVIRIVKRGYDAIAGIYISPDDILNRQLGENFFLPKPGFGVFHPLDHKISDHIVIKAANTMNAASGDKVMITLTKRTHDNAPREGIVVEVLGHGGEPAVDVLSLIRLHGIPSEWSKGVLEQAELAPTFVAEKDTEGRLDLRGTVTITIDGEDTKDVDDAVTIKRLPNRNFELGVHIADVAHYVRHGSLLDLEARNRGTSVYLADRVIPMLPKELSNGICSLNCGVDRLALSCIMQIDAKGAVVSHEIAESVIRVDRAITYTIANDIVTSGKQSGCYSEYAEFFDMLTTMNELAEALRNKRLKRGSIEFGFPEAKITLNEYGEPISITPSVRNAATGIIEEFMIAANETVAEEYFWREIPFVYRTHEKPSPDNIRQLNQFLHNFGYTIKGTDLRPGSISALLSKVEATPEEALISRMVLRSFRQARYTPENIGHFGLASKYYTHFTSPIRRYPDLTIHRIIKATLHNRPKQAAKVTADLTEVCGKCSLYERRAEQCERDVANLKKAQFMRAHIGETFAGIISGVTKNGIYVELENTVEGFISTAWLSDGYTFQQEHMCYTSHDGHSYRMGDKVAVEVKSVDTEVSQRVNFAFLNEDM
ncbi:MAG: ribonuclease R [Defluviitaleaceae bacterium]|nr:ribonuclease R [Defluviitaleaceae bacterium]